MPVTVVGSLNEDVLVRVDRLPGRGETVVGGEVVLAPGGKGVNQAAAARLGRVSPWSAGWATTPPAAGSDALSRRPASTSRPC